MTVLAGALLATHLHHSVRTPATQRGRPYRPVLLTLTRQLLPEYTGALSGRQCAALVGQVLREAEPPVATWPRQRASVTLPRFLQWCAEHWAVGLAELRQGSRRHPVAQARAVATRVTRELDVAPAVVRRGVKRGLVVLATQDVGAEEILHTTREDAR
jgi:hypothetical protein